MSDSITTQDLSPQTMEALILGGDLSKLTSAQRVEYYMSYCRRLGLDPATKPFQILTLNGKVTMYADRSCAAQINKRDGISHDILSAEVQFDCYVVKARATCGDRHTESMGAVAVSGLRGEALCNAMMKAETKAKRRSTLDLSGLGMLEESELGEWSSNGKTAEIATPKQLPDKSTPGNANVESNVVVKGKKLVSVETFSGETEKTKKDGSKYMKPWSRLGITLEGDSKCGLFLNSDDDKAIATKCEIFHARQVACDVTVKQGGKEGTWDLVSIEESDEIPMQ